MNIVVGSAFRNATWYLDRYFGQVAALKVALPQHHIRVSAVEGDSTDNTADTLRVIGQSLRIPVTVTKCEHRGPWFGSTEAPERMVALSRVGNAIFDSVTEKDDVLVYVESDLIWHAPTITALIEKAYCWEGGFDVFAPMPFAGEHFYDIWAFRKNGERFSPFPPYHSQLKATATEVDSVGSCLVMRTEVARRCRIKNHYCLVGWCEDARSQGYRIAACPDLRIYHP